MSVKLRSKKLKDGSISLYLDIDRRGKRNYEFQDLKYITKPRQKTKNGTC